MAQTDLLAGTNTEDTLRGQYLIFSMDDDLYGIGIQFVTEIVGLQRMVEVPDMPVYMKGIVNLRGQIVPVMDARLRFQKEERVYDDQNCMVVVNHNGASVGLVVDRVVEISTILYEDIAPLPDIGKRKQSVIIGIAKSDRNISLIIDCQWLLQDEDLTPLKEQQAPAQWQNSTQAV